MAPHQRQFLTDKDGRMIAAFGARAIQDIINAGHFGRFVWQSITTSIRNTLNRGTLQLMRGQMDIIGVRSVPVIMITGAFVGMTLAVQAYDQLAGMGLEEHLGVLINISVVKELGPVLAAVMLAGRVGGALTAELGTMRVTEQIDAVRSMGTDPVAYLVAPRLLACLLLTPILIIYADLMGVVGGGMISFLYLHINSRAYWEFSAQHVELWDVAIGVVKGFFFGGAIASISCYKGFTCREGAQGVGEACTEGFVSSFITILALDFALAVISKSIYLAFWPLKSLV
jgi:phospholipid/cholesterol/gamma-HCH transport system permease protein